jgi:hypothetical protein
VLLSTAADATFADMTALFYAFDFSFAFTKDLQPGGINHQVCDFTLVTFELTLTDFARLLTLV